MRFRSAGKNKTGACIPDAAKHCLDSLRSWQEERLGGKDGTVWRKKWLGPVGSRREVPPPRWVVPLSAKGRQDLDLRCSMLRGFVNHVAPCCDPILTPHCMLFAAELCDFSSFSNNLPPWCLSFRDLSSRGDLVFATYGADPHYVVFFFFRGNIEGSVRTSVAMKFRWNSIPEHCRRRQRSPSCADVIRA